jgi:4-hydroxybenzoate polyprenyltransferase
MRASVALRLGRVSNLPTVWTNTLAGIALAGGEIATPHTLLLLLVFSLFYVAGMVLNDAFDRRIDKTERPERPIPSGEMSAATAFIVGFALLGSALILLLWADVGWRALGAGLLLGLLIVLYDWRHKGVAWSPYLMGACRALIYVTAGLAFAPLPPADLWFGATIIFIYVAALTVVAKNEARQPGRTVGWLIAGIPLFDALLIASSGAGALALLAAAACPLTLILQRRIPGV